MRLKIVVFLLLILALVVSTDLLAQCATCKAALESNMQSGEEAVGKGINDGIIYIMFVPYLLVGVVGFLLYKHYRKTKDITAG